MSKEKNKDKEENTSSEEKFNPDKEQIEININPFGEIISNFSIDDLNEFLDKNVEDKKLKGEIKRKK